MNVTGANTTELLQLESNLAAMIERLDGAIAQGPGFLGRLSSNWLGPPADLFGNTWQHTDLPSINRGRDSLQQLKEQLTKDRKDQEHTSSDSSSSQTLTKWGWEITAASSKSRFRVSAKDALVLDVPPGSYVDRDVADRALRAGETYRQAQIQAEIEELRKRSPGPAVAAAQLLGQEYEAIDPHQRGDRGGTLSVESRDFFKPVGDSDLERGRHLVTHGLSDTADPSQIQADEFQAILHDNGKVTLVLPGVIDLSKPHLGYDPEIRSARDVDQEAFSSLTSTDLADNNYALLVKQFVHTQVDNGVIALGTEVLMVGHSFGGDTALDLASDPEFNGGLVNVTHVVSAAYHNEPQLGDVVNGTQVAVVQNIYDVPVVTEEVGYDLLTPWTIDGAEGVGRLGVEAGEELVEAGAHAVNGGGWVLEQSARPVNWMMGAGESKLPDVPTNIEIIGDQVTPTHNGFVYEFEGGFEGVGHHQNNYIEELNRPDLDPAIKDFLQDIGESGYGTSGSSLGVDVSLPEAPAAQPPSNGGSQPLWPNPPSPNELWNPLTSPFGPLNRPPTPPLWPGGEWP